jgi:hypothetical protein
MTITHLLLSAETKIQGHLRSRFAPLTDTLRLAADQIVLTMPRKDFAGTPEGKVGADPA